MMEGDTLQRFVLERTNVRGELVHLDATWRAVLERHDYPAPVRDLLGEAMAAAALLAATVKTDGSLIVQVQSDGPVRLLVVQAEAGRTLRGMAQWKGEVPAGSLDRMVGHGRLAITLDPGLGRERYQGIVPLEGHRTLSAALEDYFARSEQLPTRLWLAADGARTAGMLLQALPGAEPDPDAWERASHLGATLTSGELLELPSREILRRLFHEEDVRVFDPEPVSFRCGCSRQRIARVLRGLGYDEVRSILDEQGAVESRCEFCNQRYVFDRVDVEELFAAADQPDVPPTRH
ncbi:MAG TPA: Hsp33 family molecular chaperone HslO [Gammaproteobacteria bacterium]|nr:Hsp33 family molecular chaperone HslO [Gammaproteobacteria bacterium]